MIEGSCVVTGRTLHQQQAIPERGTGVGGRGDRRGHGARSRRPRQVCISFSSTASPTIDHSPPVHPGSDRRPSTSHPPLLIPSPIHLPSTPSHTISHPPLIHPSSSHLQSTSHPLLRIPSTVPIFTSPLPRYQSGARILSVAFTKQLRQTPAAHPNSNHAHTSHF